MSKNTHVLNGVEMSKLKFDRILAFRAQLPQLDDKERLGSEDIAARLGITASCVRQWLHILGHRLNRHNGRTIYAHDKSDWDKRVLPVYQKTGNAKKTAEAVGINACTVYRWLANNGHIKRKHREKDILDYKFQNYR
jgi:hypothetical protein